MNNAVIFRNQEGEAFFIYLSADWVLLDHLAFCGISKQLAINYKSSFQNLIWNHAEFIEDLGWN